MVIQYKGNERKHNSELQVCGSLELDSGDGCKTQILKQKTTEPYTLNSVWLHGFYFNLKKKEYNPVCRKLTWLACMRALV